jgi:hypothetical protein
MPGRSFLARREPRWIWIFLIYLFLAMANVRTKACLTRSYYNGRLEYNHEQLMAGKYTAPEQYRLLQYYVPEYIHRILGVELLDAYVLQRLIWVALTFCVLHLYLRRWFDTRGAMIGTLFLAATMQWTYFDHLQESEPLNIFIFLVSFYAIRENKFWRLLGFVAIGSFNKETVIFLPLAYLFCWYREMNIKPLLTRTLALFATVVLICGSIRWAYSGAPYAASWFQLGYNLLGIAGSAFLLPFKYYMGIHLGIVFLYGVFWIMALLSYRDKPLFLRRAILIVPFFIAGHLLIAKINETRLFLPLAPILIPMGLFYLFRESAGDKIAPRGGNS